MHTATTDRGFAPIGTLAPDLPTPARPRDDARVASGPRVRIWDLPTRVFHWSLAASLVGLAVTGYAGGAMMDWHALLGYAVIALLAFRVVWGFVGGRWSRFSAFRPTPSGVARYLRGRSAPHETAGHNPLGALSVFAMLAILGLQAGTGLFSDDGGGFTGPFNALVSSAAGLAATWYHRHVGQWLLLALVVLHIGAVLFYLVVRRHNLVKPMLSGDKPLSGVAPARDDWAMRLAALVLFAACLAAVAWATGATPPG